MLLSERRLRLLIREVLDSEDDENDKILKVAMHTPRSQIALTPDEQRMLNVRRKAIPYAGRDAESKKHLEYVVSFVYKLIELLRDSPRYEDFLEDGNALEKRFITLSNGWNRDDIEEFTRVFSDILRVIGFVVNGLKHKYEFKFRESPSDHHLFTKPGSTTKRESEAGFSMGYPRIRDYHWFEIREWVSRYAQANSVYSLNKKLGREMILWAGFCPTHMRITTEMIEKKRSEFPSAAVIVHPECTPEVVALADEALSTARMLVFARKTMAKQIIVGTEIGIIHRMQKDSPEKMFIPISEQAVCMNMKKINLEDVLVSLEKMQYEIKLDQKTIEKAKKPIFKMLEERL